MRQAALGRLDAKLGAAAQMGLDEAVLTRAPAASVVLRFYDWAGPALTFGYSQPWSVAAGAAREKGIPPGEVVRRATGGGLVFHDGDLTFSLCFPWPRISPPAEIYERIHRAVLAGLLQAGVEARLWVPEPGPRPRRALCFSGPEPFDLVDPDGRKLLGGALRRRLGRGLYQGSLRGGGGREAVGRGLSAGFGEGLVTGVPADWAIDPEPFVEKYRSDAWNQRR